MTEYLLFLILLVLAYIGDTLRNMHHTLKQIRDKQ